MHIADSLRGRCAMVERRPTGLGDHADRPPARGDHADRPPARVHSREWHTGRAKATEPIAGWCFELAFTRDRLGELRQFVAQGASEASLDPARIGDFVLTVNELATNSVCHGGGAGTLRIWREGDMLLCDVSDQGHIQQQSVCLTPPDPTQISGRGLWIVSQLCDFVQIRSSHGRSVVRVHMRLT
jgi:anti-sigma regulatory factor (Ser/Thr protein kinase)